jgi:hypothetical protein
MCAGLLSNGSEERSARLMELGVGELLMTALRVHHSSPGVQQWALSAAGNLACNNEERSESLMVRKIDRCCLIFSRRWNANW